MKAVKISERREEEVGERKEEGGREGRKGRRKKEGGREGKGGGRREGSKGRKKREEEEVYVNDSFVCDTLTGMLFGLG